MDDTLLEKKIRAIQSLSDLVKRIGAAGLATNRDVSLWKKDQERDIIADALWLSEESSRTSA